MEKVQIKDLLASLIDNKQQQDATSKVNQHGLSVAHEFHQKGKKMKVKHISKKKQNSMLRETNYQTAKEDLDKWVGIVKLNREKQFLNFVPKTKYDAKINFISSQPQTQFQKKINGELSKANLDTAKKVMNVEQKLLENVDPEQAKKRLFQARKHRTTVFYEQIKRRRIAKIKSKLYRKIKKRQRQRQDAKKVGQMTGQQRSEYLQKITKKRIHQRITLKHKTKNKHILNLLRFNKSDKNTYQESVNQVNRIRQHQLKKVNQEFLDKISEQYDDQNYRQQAIEDLQRQLVNLEEDQMEIERQENNNLQKKGGVDGMKFMKIAKQRQLQKDKSQAYKLLNKLAVDGQQIQISDQQHSDSQQAQERTMKHSQNGDKQHQGLLTRKQYGNKDQAQNSRNKTKNIVSIQKNLSRYFTKKGINELTEGIDVAKLKQKYQPNRVEMDLTHIAQKNKQIFDNISNEAVLQNLKQFQKQKIDQYDQAAGMDQKPKSKGWGTWAGPGIQQKKIDPKAQLRKKLAKIQEIKKKRRDGSMSNVVINQSRNKNLSNFMVRKLPHEFKSSQQFDYLQGNSIGPEWNSMNQFRDNIKPKIKTQTGVTIEPIKLPKKMELLKRGNNN